MLGALYPVAALALGLLVGVPVGIVLGLHRTSLVKRSLSQAIEIFERLGPPVSILDGRNASVMLYDDSLHLLWHCEQPTSASFDETDLEAMEIVDSGDYELRLVDRQGSRSEWVELRDSVDFVEVYNMMIAAGCDIRFVAEPAETN